jgi:DNA (cytosine-5)-methyltransferase 1
MTMKALELFAGAGGLALGTSNAGFEHFGVVEWNRNACDTIRENNQRGVIDWPLYQGDVREFDFGQFRNLDLVAGGPPCQPFSIGGKHRGHTDHRNLFPHAIRAIRETRPRAVLIENVKGLLRPAFAKFLEYVLLQITYPEIVAKPREEWARHLSRLEQYHTRGRKNGLSYQVVFRKLNAADYGVAQRRERVFIVGFRNDIDANWSFPEPTHSRDALLYSQWVTGEYWDRYGISKRSRPVIPNIATRQVLSLRRSLFPPDREPWWTVRDAIADLPDPLRPNEVPNHRHNPGARTYPGHAGSPMDEPAKTLKAGDHGVPGGENMLLHPNGKVRYFTVRESARLQSFPDDFVFMGSWTESMRQLGNAVAVNVAQVVAASIKATLGRAT